MNIGTKLKAIRESNGLHQHEVASRAGLTQSALSDIENGKISPRRRTIERLLTTLGFSAKGIEDFMTEAKLQELDMLDPGFILMLKDVPSMTSEEKQSIMDAYELVKFKRERKRHD